MREKFHWNKRISELGGPDYNKVERLNQIAEASEDQNSVGLQGSSGYRYYGVAKNLPGVKELFMRNAVKLTKRKRGDVYKFITPDYYGLRDEEDGVLLDVEIQASEKRRLALEKYRKDFRSKQENSSDSGVIWVYHSEDDDEEMASSTAVSAHVAVPTQDIVEQSILAKKKKKLLDALL